MSDKNSSGGTSGTTLLQVAFIILKLCHVINWSWWWVLSPSWIGLIVAGICFLAYLIIKSK